MKLDYFKTEDFHTSLRIFFKNLNIPVNYIAEEPARPQAILSDHPAFQLMKDVYFLGMLDDAAFEGSASLAPEKIESDYDGILIFGVTLNSRDNGMLPTRSQLAEITRSFNREFHYTPVVIVFKYGNYLAFANTERLKYKQEWREGEKAGKVSLLRDIDITNLHSGHERILNDLKIPTTGKNKVDSFAKLYAYWQDVFSVNILNKNFYQELSKWYFWAVKEVHFPSEPTVADEHLKKIDLPTLRQEHNAKNVIRLLTRFLFVWFVKEKKLIPEELFDIDYLKDNLLKDLRPKGLLKKANIESIYYKAILQNLFFASLNCPIKPIEKGDNRERGFRSKKNFGQHRDANYLMRYKDQFKNPEKFLKLLNEVVPFLNGGLFECLDNKTDKIYIDGFSDNLVKPHQLIVPDYLFFGFDKEVDLSGVVGINTKAYKKASVKGLIHLLESYKFTIAENTPIEEDVALDPELLGKVFENLLASYNPETKTTARKQTGSFYTPREIVNYMVDESLIAYLKNSVKNWKSKADGLDKQLHDLLSFDNINPFAENDDLQKQIIHSLDNCKTLDPACGSGAFPMGILQKMVHILQKVDPENKYWQELQLNKAVKATEGAFVITDKKEREQKLIEINDAFDEKINDPDYARKLFLVEDCIYGVDIQPIAAQISKLRFFISLIVDQKVDKDKPNFGIRALPNLETKFVTANTLVGIEKPKKQMSLFENQKVEELEKELKNVRHRIFSAKSPATKRRLRDKDKEIREKMGELLVKHGWANETAKQLASWDPYDQNASSPFFDPEWMFDIKDGFDVVIGNPPYGADIDDYIKLFKKIYPKTSKRFKDSYKYFFNCSLEKLIKESGVLIFITPNTFFLQPRYSDLRKLLLEYRIVKLINLGEEVFDAVVPAAISMISGSKDTDANIIKFSDLSDASKYSGDLSNLNYKFNNQKQYLETPNNIFTENIRLKKDDEEPLGNIIDFKDAGINYQRINVGLADKGNSDLSRRLLYEGDKEDASHVEYWKGVDINNFYIQPNTNRYVRPYIKLNQNERVVLNRDYFAIAPKLLWRQTAPYPITAIDRTGIWFGRSIQAGIIKETFQGRVSYEYLSCILNSSYIKDVYGNTVKEGGRVFPQVKLEKLKPLPIKIIPIEYQRPFVWFAKYIEFLKFGPIIHTVDFLFPPHERPQHRYPEICRKRHKKSNAKQRLCPANKQSKRKSNRTATR
jgi:hypothetical protein